MQAQAQTTIDPKRLEALGPAERTVNAITAYTDHLYHNRSGIVLPNTATPIGTTWFPVTWKDEAGQKGVYQLNKVGSKTVPQRLGILSADGKTVRDVRGVAVGEYRLPGLYPEAVAWTYRQVADIWKMDNDFVAHLASWAHAREHRDLKVVLAAFMLVQSRAGAPVMDGGKVAFHDDDHRAIGEAMCLIRQGGAAGKNDFNPKLIARVGDVLKLPQVAEINRTLGFGKSAKNPTLGRWPKAVEKWLANLEANPKSLASLVKAGFRTTVMQLSRTVGYKPETPAFFAVLRWKQVQSADGRRTVAIGVAVAPADTWEGLDEKGVCKKIGKDKPNYKRLVGLLPPSVGLTRAVMAAAIEAGCLSPADLVILTPTLEDLGLLNVPDVAAKWKAACDAANNQRAVNIAKNVKSAEVAEVLVQAADTATAKVLEEVTRGLRVYVVVDKSGSMENALVKAKEYLTQFLGGFPLDRCHVSVFNTIGTEIVLKANTAVAVEHAFKGHNAAGGTLHCEGVRVLVNKYKPAEGEDALFIFIGDEGDTSGGTQTVIDVLRYAGVAPVAFGMLHVGGHGTYVHDVARELGIPCFDVDVGIFKDVYAVTRTLRHLIATTPVGQSVYANRAPVVATRKPLIREVLETPLLAKPLWAA